MDQTRNGWALAWCAGVCVEESAAGDVVLVTPLVVKSETINPSVKLDFIARSDAANKTTPENQEGPATRKGGTKVSAKKLGFSVPSPLSLIRRGVDQNRRGGVLARCSGVCWEESAAGSVALFAPLVVKSEIINPSVKSDFIAR